VVITEVRIKLMEENNERLHAFCSVTLDDAFVVRDLKIIEGTRGMFVAMPSRKLMDRCGCGCKNHLRARFCNQCGRRLDENRATRGADGRAKLHADIAHPIHSVCRDSMQNEILKAYEDEKVRAKQPGYVCRYDDLEGDFEEYFDSQAGRSPEVFRVHGSHAPQGNHAAQQQKVAERNFGSGIFEQ
jgi:stage V sporulation protein G